jgi:hypothetical protein
MRGLFLGLSKQKVRRAQKVPVLMGNTPLLDSLAYDNFAPSFANLFLIAS